MIDDFVQPSRMLSHELTEQCEGEALLGGIGLLQTLMQLVENVVVVRRLNLDEHFKHSI